MQEIQETFNALNDLLKSDKVFAEVVEVVFGKIDEDGSGAIDLGELKKFIGDMCADMGIKKPPKEKEMEDMFKEFDEDGNKKISKDELGKFLRILFEEQRDQLGKQLKKSHTIAHPHPIPSHHAPPPKPSPPPFKPSPPTFKSPPAPPGKTKEKHPHK